MSHIFWVFRTPPPPLIRFCPISAHAPILWHPFLTLWPPHHQFYTSVQWYDCLNFWWYLKTYKLQNVKEVAKKFLMKLSSTTWLFFLLLIWKNQNFKKRGYKLQNDRTSYFWWATYPPCPILSYFAWSPLPP